MPHADLNGFEIHYDVHGEGDPLICVHGLGCDRRAWALQIQPFSERFRAVFFDNRDVGQSSLASAGYSTADMAQDVLALADHSGSRASTCSASRWAEWSRSRSRWPRRSASARSRWP